METGEQIPGFVARDAETALHPSCTCRMGVDDLAMVRPVQHAGAGLAGLRVADASAMPHITNGDIYAPAMMMAEKAADLILGREPLAPENVGYYRDQTQCHLL